MRCCILTIGYELLQGRVVNTNASYIARKLTVLGHDVVFIASVGDNYEHISSALDISIKNFGCDVVITTGGLGPTPDDITLSAIARYLGIELELNSDALKEIESKCKAKGLDLTPERIKMAYLPKGSKPIPNPVGMAPGMLLKTRVDNREVVIVALPGVPKEMQSMFESYVEPMLKGSKILIESEILVVPGIEAEITPLLKNLQTEFPRIYVKSHPEGLEYKEPRVRLYISLYAEDVNQGLALCNNVIQRLSRALTGKGLNIIVLKSCSEAK